MDGVLVDSEPYHIEIEKRMFRKMKLDISDEEHAAYMGTATDVMWSAIAKSHKLKLDVQQITQLTVNEGLQLFESLPKIDPMPGLEMLLNELHRAGVPMAVASSSDEEIVNILLKKSGLKQYFNCILSSGTVGKSKPAPDVYLHAAKCLGQNPHNCLVIEDSKNGISAAKAAGMYCIAYSGTTTGGQDQRSADKIVATYHELKELLANVLL